MITRDLAKLRIAVCLSHPIQYKTPVLRCLAANPEVDLKVFYYSKTGVISRVHDRFGTVPSWDVPVLGGYCHQVLKDFWPWRDKQVGFLNPGIVLAIMSFRSDAVIIHSYCYLSDWLAWATARLSRKPVIFYGDLYDAPEKRRKNSRGRDAVKKLMLWGAGHCLAIGTRASMVYHRLGVPSDRISLAPYCVDNEFFIKATDEARETSNQLRRELGIAPEEIVVICVAKLIEEKCHEDLFEAINRLNPRPRLLLVGDGPRHRDLECLAEKTLPGTIFAGFVNQVALPGYYALADIFALSSKHEAFGLVVNEAMCAGLPIVASSEVGCVTDLIEDGGNGFVFPARDVLALGRCIGILVNDAVQRKAFGARSRQLIKAWGPDRAAAGIIDAVRRAGGGA